MSNSAETPFEPQQTVAARDARGLIAAARFAALATLDAETGHPHVSLVGVATQADHTAILLLSALARHTRNIMADGRASLLFTAHTAAADPASDPLAASRVTVIGHMNRASDDTASAIYLARHPSAAQFAGFGDFAYFRLDVELAHFIGGFGRIITLPRAAIVGA